MQNFLGEKGRILQVSLPFQAPRGYRSALLEALVRFANNVSKSKLILSCSALKAAKSNKLQIISYMPQLSTDLHEFNARVRLLCDYLFNKIKILHTLVVIASTK